MPIESHQIYAASAKAQTPAGLARSMNLQGVGHVYELMKPFEYRHSIVRDDIERFTAMCEGNATRGEDGRVANTLAEVYMIELFDRLNRNERPKPLTCETAVAEAAELCGHMRDVLDVLSKKGGPIPDRVAVEISEMIVALRRVLMCAEAADDQPVKLRKV